MSILDLAIRFSKVYYGILIIYFLQFKKAVLPKLEKEHAYMRSDIYLIRWLRAKNLNLRQAENMLMEV